MDKRWVVDLVERVPQGVVSRAWGWLARRRRPRIAVEVLKRVFVSAAGIDMGEARDRIGSYSTLESLFVRELRPGARRVDPDPEALISPVDGRVGMCGTVEDGTLLQVKGRQYQLARLLGDEQQAKRFDGGDYATIYLSPRDYHRIHAPVSGQVAEAALIPGALMPVFQEALDSIDELLARNERLITYIDSPDAGRVAVIKVGATMVGRITAAYDPEIQTNVSGQTRRRLDYDPPRLVQKGAELGAFEMGSTVVLVTEAGRVRLDGLEAGGRVRMGRRIGTLLARARSSRGKSPGKKKNKRRAVGGRARKTRPRAD